MPPITSRPPAVQRAASRLWRVSRNAPFPVSTWPASTDAAITTFGVAASLQLVALNAGQLTGGPFGIALIPHPFDRLANLALVAALTAACFVGRERLVRSLWGRVLRALREDEVAATSLRLPPA